MKNCALCNRPCGSILYEVQRCRQGWGAEDEYASEYICEQCWTEAKRWFVAGELNRLQDALERMEKAMGVS